MRKAHRGAPLCLIKTYILDDFKEWCKQLKAEETNRNLLEYLIQKKFIQGPVFLDYIDKIHLPMLITMRTLGYDMMREGFIPPRAWIGKRKGRSNDR